MVASEALVVVVVVFFLKALSGLRSNYAFAVLFKK